MTQFESLYAAPSRNGIYKSNEFHGSGCKIVNMGELFAYPFLGNQEMKRLQVDDSELARFHLADGDLLFARRSLIESGAGKCVLVVDPDEPLVFESSLIRVRLDRAKALPRFYYYYFSSPVGRARVTPIITGAAQKGIRGSELAQIQVHSPPLATQRRIAGILSAYDDLIENNTKRIKILEEMARALYREWFVHFRFPGHEKVKLVDSPLGQIPEGWKAAELGELVEERRESVKPEELDPSTPYFGLEHLPRRSITLGEWGEVADVASTKLRAAVGDILFGKIRPYFHKVGVCPIESVCSSDTIILRPREPRWASLATAVTSSDEFVQQATQTSGGTKMPRANWNVLTRYGVPVPSPRVLKRFNDFMEPLVERLRIFIFQNQNLRETRDLLLPRLISGELDVDNLDLPEAAE